MKQAFIHNDPDGICDPVVALRDTITGDAFCLGCKLVLASTDEDEEFGLPVGQVVRDPASGWLITLCPDCRSTFSKQAP